ncbi:MAG: right-handed parallel beta-helix repeat-containing protein [Verrucomicrobiae bacterium]|nr:right-handed parallel beta-helix repeat-containing protein [Verrucomicrobiae bacterium]
MPLLGLLALLILFAASSGRTATFTVTTTAESGAGSLTQAILDANANPGPDVIVFAIPPFDTTTKSIVFNSTPPPITDAVFINGYSQPNSSPNTLVSGHNAVILIRLVEPSGSFPLAVSAPDCEIRGLKFEGLTVQIFGLSNVVVAGNFFGTADGLTAGSVPIFYNIQVLNGDGHRIGGPNPADRNLIVNSTDAAILLSDAGNGQRVENNYIGTQRNGTSPIGNAGDGIEVIGSGTSIILSNIIAFGTEAGIRIQGASGQTIRNNRIFGNGGLGIDLLGVTGPDANDACDNDTGANDLQNFPVLLSATGDASSLTVAGTLNSTILTDYVIEFFANSNCDATGFGEGAIPIGSTVVTTDGNCLASFSVTLPVSVTNAPVITATATDPNGNTSEFSECITANLNLNANLGVTVTDSPDPVFVSSPLTYSIVVTNFGPNPALAVTVTNFVPAGATFSSATPSTGSCTNLGPLVRCDLGTLGTNTTATITLVVTPTIPGTATNSTQVSSAVPDPFLANNFAQTLTTVTDSGCPSNVTSLVSVRVGRLLHNYRTGRCYHRVTITNTSNQNIPGPVYLVLQGLPTGATLLNATGTTTCPLLSGLPYRTVNATSRVLQPGRRLSTMLEYRLQPGVCPTFTPIVLAGAGTP